MIERTTRLAVALLWVLLTLACSQGPTTGPGEVHWDRQTCEGCQMVISERRHAVQTRTPGDHATHAFDDLGCALLWLDEQGLTQNEPPVEVWVRDAKGKEWISAETTRFEAGLPTPMAYGFAAAEQGISLEEVHEQIRAAKQSRRPHSEHGEHRGGGPGG